MTKETAKEKKECQNILQVLLPTIAAATIDEQLSNKSEAAIITDSPSLTVPHNYFQEHIIMMKSQNTT